jgi:DNA-directed RNA polymerase subunit M/transcription elongation factor TFIIS
LGIHHNASNLKEVKEYPRRTELCPNCFRVIFERKDFIHGHYFCERCGYVTKDILVVDNNGHVAEFEVSTLTKKRIPEHFVYPKKNINKLRNIYEKEGKSREEYRVFRDYKHFLDIIASNFQMTPEQRNRVFFGIKKAKGVNFFCKNCKYEEIILSLCIMVMRNDDRRIRFKDYSFIKEVGLSESKYIKVIEKANLLGIKW